MTSRHALESRVDFLPMDKIFIDGLKIPCVIGIFPWERKIRQPIVIDLEFPANIRKASRTDKIQDAVDYKKISKFTLSFVGKSQFFLIETLAEKLAAALIKKFHLREIQLRVSKPGALRHANNVGLVINRKK